MKKIKRNSWHYRVFREIHEITKTELPQPTTLWGYRRCFFGQILFLILIGFAFIVARLIYYVYFVSKTIWQVFWGIGRPASIKDATRFVPYPPLKLGKFLFYPWHVGLPILSVAPLALLYYVGTPSNVLTVSQKWWLIIIVGIIEVVVWMGFRYETELYKNVGKSNIGELFIYWLGKLDSPIQFVDNGE